MYYLQFSIKAIVMVFFNEIGKYRQDEKSEEVERERKSLKVFFTSET